MSQALGAPCQSKLGSMIQTEIGSALGCLRLEGPFGLILLLTRLDSFGRFVLGDLSDVTSAVAALPTGSQVEVGVVSQNLTTDLVRPPVRLFPAANAFITISELISALVEMQRSFDTNSVDFIRVLAVNPLKADIVNDDGSTGGAIENALKRIGQLFPHALLQDEISVLGTQVRNMYGVLGFGVLDFHEFADTRWIPH